LQGRVTATEEIQRNSRLDFDDATSDSAMKRTKISEIVSFDRDFDKITGVSRIEPREALGQIHANDKDPDSQ